MHFISLGMIGLHAQKIEGRALATFDHMNSFPCYADTTLTFTITRLSMLVLKRISICNQLAVMLFILKCLLLKMDLNELNWFYDSCRRHENDGLIVMNTIGCTDRIMKFLIKHPFPPTSLTRSRRWRDSAISEEYGSEWSGLGELWCRNVNVKVVRVASHSLILLLDM